MRQTHKHRLYKKGIREKMQRQERMLNIHKRRIRGLLLAALSKLDLKFALQLKRAKILLQIPLKNVFESGFA